MADTTLSALFPGVPFRVAGERLTLLPITLGDLPAVERVLDGWRILLVTGGRELDPGAWEDFLDLLASASGQSMAWVKALDEVDFEHLVGGVLAINHELLEGQENRGPSDSLPWSQIVAKLVAAGHAWSAVQGMTLSQAREFLSEAYRQGREDLATGIVASSYSMADGKAVQRVVKDLRNG